MSQQYPSPNPPPASGATPAPITGATPAPAAETAAPSATGATPGPQTLTSAPPPDYSDIYKRQQQPPPQQPAQGYTLQPQGFPIQPQFAYMQQPAMQPAVQPIQYMMPAPMQMVAVTPRPNYPGPHDFLIFALIVAIVCGFLNITSLVFGVIAVVFAVMSKTQKDSADYPSSKKYGTAALALTICNIIYTLVFIICSVAISLGLWFRYTCNYLRHSDYSGYYCSIYS